MDEDGYVYALHLNFQLLTSLQSYLYITGRSKEIINKGGEVISPFEVEEAIMTAAKHCVKVRYASLLCGNVLHFLRRRSPSLSSTTFCRRLLVWSSCRNQTRHESVCRNCTTLSSELSVRSQYSAVTDFAFRPHLHPSKWPFLIVYMNDLPKNK